MHQVPHGPEVPQGPDNGIGERERVDPGGAFRVFNYDNWPLEDGININLIQEAAFPEAAKNLAIAKLERELKRKHGRGIKVKQTTAIKVVREADPPEQRSIFNSGQ